MRTYRKNEEKLMRHERTWITTTEAAKILKCSSRNIVKLIEHGKLSATLEGKKYYIEKAEFYRVYPWAIHEQEQQGKKEKLAEELNSKLIEEKNAYLLDMIKEKSKQIDFLKEQLNNFTQEKSKLIDAINSHARLLEYKEKPASDTYDNIPVKKKMWSKLFSKD